VEGATGILLNITGGGDLGLFEVNEAAEIVQSAADHNSNIIFGAVIDEGLADEVRVTVIATGFDKRRGGGLFDVERGQPRGRERPRDRGDIAMDDRQRSSLEISEDEIDIPSFLKD
jgi:cell division protein FtsZ